MGTWKLIKPLPSVNIIGSKWTYKAKKDASGTIVCKKARLVAQGFSQVPGVDYFDMFAPVACLTSIHTVLALAACLDMEAHQIDIKGAYLYGTLNTNKVIYMQQPTGFVSKEYPNWVCQLVKTLYSLKQSGRRWYQKLVEIIIGHLKFTQCDVDQAVFFKCTTDGGPIIIVVHVDDCTITATSIAMISEFKSNMKKYVEVTDLGELHWLLGIEIVRNREACTISMSQHSYINSITCHFSFEDLKPLPAHGSQFSSICHTVSLNRCPICGHVKYSISRSCWRYDVRNVGHQA